MSKYLWYIMMDLRSNGYFVTHATCLNEGHDYERYSQCGPPEVGLGRPVNNG